MSPKDVMKFTEYMRTRKEAWRVESRSAVEDEFADVAPRSTSSASIASASISSASAASPAPDGWRMHLRDQFGEAIVEFFAAEIDGAQ